MRTVGKVLFDVENQYLEQKSLFTNNHNAPLDYFRGLAFSHLINLLFFRNNLCGKLLTLEMMGRGPLSISAVVTDRPGPSGGGRSRQ